MAGGAHHRPRLHHNDGVTSLRDVVLLGSTGSIGTQAIEVVRQNPDRFRVTGISAGGGNLGLLAQQAVALRVEAVGVAAGDRDDVTAALDRAARDAGVHGFAPELLIGPEANTGLAGSAPTWCSTASPARSGCCPRSPR